MIKDSNHKTRAIRSIGGEINIGSQSQAFKLISRIQNEVHRFAISYHRTKRKKNTLNLNLTEIPMIGEKHTVELLKHFKTLEAMREY